MAHADETLRSAITKEAAGQPLTRDESSALRRARREREERTRWEYYAAIPQKHWRQMSGRQAKVLQEQADRYGLPFAGATVDLPALVRALHDFLRDNGRKLLDDDDPMSSGDTTPALERWRHHKANLAELDEAERRQSLVPRESMHAALGHLAGILRNAADNIQRHHGQEAGRIIDDALDEFESLIAHHFADASATPAAPTPTQPNTTATAPAPAKPKPKPKPKRKPKQA